MLKDIYKDDLLIVIPADKCKDGTSIAIIRNNVEIKDVEGYKVMHYEDNFEDLVTFTLPTKSRKPHTLISLNEIEELLDEIRYGTLAYEIDGIPYAYTMNHIIWNGKLYFHTGRKGFKLKGIGKRACFTLMKDLGLAKAGTHNFKSIMMFGTLVNNEDFETKKGCFTRIVEHNNPNHVPFRDEMTITTTLIEFDLEFMIGRENIYE